MTITLDTVIGNTKAVEEDALIFPQMEIIPGRTPTFTANLAERVSSGYVAIETPDNLSQFLIDRYASNLFELATIYAGELEEHNKKAKDAWDARETDYEKRLQAWQTRHREKVEHHKDETRTRKEILEESKTEYERRLEQERIEKESRGLGPYTILNALETLGHTTGTIRRIYERDGRLNEGTLGHSFLHKILGMHDVKDADVLTDINSLFTDGELIEPEKTWPYLAERLKFELPKVEDDKVTTPTKPEITPSSIPKIEGLVPEQRPERGPTPDIREKPIPDILKELEIIVTGAYHNADPASLKITKDAWDEIELDLDSLYATIRGEIRGLNSNHMLVRVNGVSEVDGDITLLTLSKNNKAGLRNGLPKELRQRFRTPTEVVNDVYSMIHVTNSTYRSRIIIEEENDIPLEKLDRKYQTAILRQIFAGLLGKESDIFRAVFQPTDNEDGLLVESVGDEDARQYQGSVERAIQDIRDEMGNKGRIYGEKDSVFYSPERTIDAARQLLDFFPDELFALRLTKNLDIWFGDQLKIYAKAKKGKGLTNEELRNEDLSHTIYDREKRRQGEITEQLGILTEGTRNWRMEPPSPKPILALYGLTQKGAT